LPCPALPRSRSRLVSRSSNAPFELLPGCSHMNSLGLRLMGGGLVRGHQGQTNRDVLVVGRARDGIAVAAFGEQIDPRAVDQTLSVRRGVCLTVAMRQR